MSGTRQQQTAAIDKAFTPDCASCATEPRVHIAGECDAEIGSNPNNINGLSSENTVAMGSFVPGAVSSVGRAGASHASGREFKPLTAHQSPSYRRFKSIGDHGFAAYFWSLVRVDGPANCWIWQGVTRGDGLGQIRVGGTACIASRIAFALSTGESPGNATVRHSCSTVSCCNPSHLFLGSQISRKPVQLDVAVLREYLVCDFETGVCRWIKTPGLRIKTGDIAGNLNDRGYMRVALKGQSFKLHRVVWALAHGAWPLLEIDHINGVKTDNRLANLREVTRRQNQNNLSRHRTALT